MRYEVIQLAQFIFSLVLIFGAFGVGLFVGWCKWARRDGPVRVGDGIQPIHDPMADAGSVGRRPNLFSPDGSGKTRSLARSSRVVVLGTEDIVDLTQMSESIIPELSTSSKARAWTKPDTEQGVGQRRGHDE